MEKEKKKGEEPKQLNIKEVTTCEATTQMLRKAEKDGVEIARCSLSGIVPSYTFANLD